MPLSNDLESSSFLFGERERDCFIEIFGFLSKVGDFDLKCLRAGDLGYFFLVGPGDPGRLLAFLGDFDNDEKELDRDILFLLGNGDLDPFLFFVDDF